MTEIFNKTEEKFKRVFLRNRATDAEKQLWEVIRKKQLGCKFRRQFSIYSFVLDFYCPEIRLELR